MNWLSKILLISLLCACASGPPPRDYEVALWAPNVETQSFSNYDEDTGITHTIFTAEDRFEDFILITPEDYLKERKYQELLIKSCKEWR